MDPSLLARAIVLGFTVAAAVGPIALLTIRRTLAHGRVYGLASGMGVALADASYAAIAAFGLTAVTSLLVDSRMVLGLLGGVVLIWLAVRTIRSRPAAPASDGSGRPGLAAAIASIYGLTMTNPMTILSFAALFGALGFSGGDAAGALALTAGVFLGSALWWVVLTTAVAWLRARVTLGALTWVNRISGLVLLVFGLGAVVGAVVAR